MKLVVFISLIVMTGAESLQKKMYNTFLADADVVTLATLTNNGEAINLETCGSDGDAFKVESAKFDIEKFTLTVTGDLQRQLVGGNVSANISLGKSADGASWKERLMRSVGFHLRPHKYNEPLCQHLERGFRRHNVTGFACPVAESAKTLHFSLRRLPEAVAAGEYKFTVKAHDEVGKVLCMRGAIAVQRGPNGQFFRRLDEHEASSSHGLVAGLLPFLFMVSAHM